MKHEIRASRLAVEVTLELHVWLEREIHVLRQALCETKASGSAFRYCIDDRDASFNLCVLAVVVKQKREF